MTRQQPLNPIIAAQLTPQAQTVNTRVQQARYNENVGNSQSLLQTADALSQVNTSVTKVNAEMMKDAEIIAQKEFTKNQQGWVKETDKQPLSAVFNPHVKGTLNRLKSENEIKLLFNDFQQQYANNYEIDSEEYLQALNNVKGEAFKIAEANGTSYHDIQNKINPTLNQFEQNNWASFNAGKTKYEYEQTINNATEHTKDLIKDADFKSLDHTSKVSVLNNYATELNLGGLSKTDTAKVVLTAIQDDYRNKLNKYQSDPTKLNDLMTLKPYQFEALLQDLDINGKSLSDLGLGASVTEVMDKMNKLKLSAIKEADWMAEHYQKHATESLITEYGTEIYKLAEDGSYKGNYTQIKSYQKQTLAKGYQMGIKDIGKLSQDINTFTNRLLGIVDDRHTDPSVFNKLSDKILNNTLTDQDLINNQNYLSNKDLRNLKEAQHKAVKNTASSRLSISKNNFEKSSSKLIGSIKRSTEGKYLKPKLLKIRNDLITLYRDNLNPALTSGDTSLLEMEFTNAYAEMEKTIKEYRESKKQQNNNSNPTRELLQETNKQTNIPVNNTQQESKTTPTNNSLQF